MAKVINPSLSTIQKSLNKVFPELERIAPLHLLGEGFGSLVVETPTGIVFRIAKNHIVCERHKREQTLLGLLNSEITGFAIPQPLFYSDTSKWFPFGVIGYQKIKGQELKPNHLSNGNMEIVASSIARFINHLQSIEISNEIKKLHLPAMPPGTRRLNQLWEKVSPYLKHKFDDEEYRTLTLWWKSSIQYWKNYQYKPVLVHGDLWYENIIMSSDYKTVNGIIDFESMAIGDPWADLVTQKYLGPDFLNTVINNYVSLNSTVEFPELEYHLDRLMGLRELIGLEYGIDINFIDEDTITKIRNSILKRL